MYRTPSLRVLVFALVIAAFLVVSGCSGGGGDTGADSGSSGQSATAPEGNDGSTTASEGSLYTPSYQPNGSETALIKTSKGDVTVKLFGDDAPIHVGNFVELAEKGFYDGTKFHRYVPGFVVQGGDPNSKALSSEGVVDMAYRQETGQIRPGEQPLGTGGPGYTIKAEYDPAINPNKHAEGALGMARSQMPDSAGSQFYFALAPLPQLDGSYTVFGQITEGMDVMKALGIGDEILSIEITGKTE